MSHTYNPTQWALEDPITRERLMQIENGIKNAQDDANAAQTGVNNVNSTLTTHATNINDIRQTANNALSTANTANDNTIQGQKAWTQVAGAITIDPVTGNVTENLATKLGNMNTRISDATANIGSLSTEITNARGSLVHNGNSAQATNLKAKLDDMDTQISLNKGAISSTRDDYNSAKGTYNNLTARLDASDTAVSAVTSEVQTARDSAASLNARLDAIDNSTRPSRNLPNVITEIDNAHRTTNDTLDSRFDSIDGGSAPSRTLPNVITEINDAHRASVSGDTLNQRFNSIDTNIGTINTNLGYTGLSSTQTVKKKVEDAIASAQSTLESRIDLLDNATTGRVSELESEVSDASGDFSTLDERLDDIEATANAAAVATTTTQALNSLDNRLDKIDGGSALANVTPLATRVSNIETEISTARNGKTNLDTRLDEMGTAISGFDTDINTANTGLKARVTALEGRPQTTTVIIESVTYNSTTGKPTSIQNPSEDTDYLLKKDDKYYYWKYINNTWHLISGAGAGGSVAEFYTTLANVPNPPSDNVDYFIGSGTNYIHYRYYNNAWITVLPAHLINSVAVDNSPTTGTLTKSRPIIKEIGSENNLLAGFSAIQSFSAETVEDGYKLTWVNIDGESEDITITGGSGGGSNTNITAGITRVTDGSITSISGEPCNISFKFVAKDSNNELLETTSQGSWSINRIQVATSTVRVNDPEDDDDYNTFNITEYLHTGDNNIVLTVTTTVDNEVITRTKTWTVNVVNFSLVWDYDESTINDEEVINFSCIPYGIDISKTLHLKVGVYEQTQTVTTSGIPTIVSLPNNYNHGNYTAEMWMTATINGQSKTSNHITHDFIVAEPGNNNPIIAASLPSSTMDQYNTMTIPFVVYTPGMNTSTVVLAVDGTEVDTREGVGRTVQNWYYTPLTAGAKVLTLTSGGVTKTLNLTVNTININNNEIGNYTFKLKASEIPSNNALRAWYYDSNNQNNTKLQFSNNFDWVNGGIQTELDENEQIRQFIRVKSGTTMTIPFEMFASDPRENGADFKIIFKIDNCRDYDASALTNISENIGIQLKAHRAIFKSTTTEINTQYGEDEYTELEFEVYKSTDSLGNAVAGQYMMAWIDGVITTARQYGGNFMQSNEHRANIVIGSSDCDICVYLIKYYPFALSRDDHVTNFIADAPNAVEMMRRYNRNNILDADGDISPDLLAQRNPDCRVWLYDIDRMTTGKKDKVKVNTFQQIWNNGSQYYQLQGTNAQLTVQGTSSVNYRKGAANTDINFGVDGATLVDGNGNDLLSDSLPVKGFKINDNSVPITYSNTKVNFASCEQVNNMCNAEWYQRYQPFPSLTPRDCMEFAMGVQFIKDRGIDEPTDPNTHLQEVRLFNEKPNRSDQKFYMYSIANMGNSKKNTHIFHGENECCIEIKENTSDAQKMKSFDSTWTDNNDNTDNYEMRYPDLKNTQVPTNIRNGWARFVQWMVASNPNAATGAALDSPVTFGPYTFRGHNREVTSVEGRNFEQVLRGVSVSQYAGTYDHDTFEYRMAKMLSECEDYMAMDSVIYHFCFIERHTMVDNVAKNTFWSSNLSNQYINGVEQENTSGYWIWDLSKNYDNDTADGNNNNGLLVFDYGNEAADTREGTPVFNGYDTVWFVFASHLFEACQAMFINRENKGAWNSMSYHNYLLNEQRKVPERVWNECYWYDYLRTYENAIETSWINFLDGGQKTHQRAHYETYQEIYEASKYQSPFSQGQAITLRGEAIDYQTLGLPAQESKFVITMFNKCYLTVWIGTNKQKVKCEKGVPVTLNFYEDNDPSKGYMSLANSVINIDSGSMVQAIGDLSRIYPSSGQFGTARRLRSLQIGSDTAGYYNPNMNTNSVLTFNNKMLEYLYVQNLPQATYNLDLSNCPELKYINAAGSGFTGFVFANGGLLNEAHLNAPASLVMCNLNHLTKANFYITNPLAVTSLRLENCRLFDNFTFLSELTNLNTIRLTNISWTLSSTTLLDNLLSMMGINEIGSSISQSYLSGTITLTGTVYEGDYNQYMAAWSPDLIIDRSGSNFISQHLVRYVNINENNEEVLVHSQYINAGGALIDPYLNGLVTDSQVHKDADIQSYYTFGELDNTNTYIPFSGWKKRGESLSLYRIYGENATITVSGEMTLVSVFTANAQRYQVRWLLRPGTNPVKVSANQINYGAGYDLIAPTVKEVQDTGANTYIFNSNGDLCSYSIMTGWDKLPTNIAPTEIGGTYDIYATWLTRENVDYHTVLSSDTYSVEEKLLVLKEMSDARSTLRVANKYPVTLGYDGLKPAINLVSTPTRYNGSAMARVITEYTPFAADKSFTLAIDYRFENKSSTVANEAVLISCYGNTGAETGASVQGFKLFYDPKSNTKVPKISFGSTAQAGATNVKTIGTSIDNRGIVVLRHRAGSNILYVYTGSSENGLESNYSSNFRKTIQWSENTTSAQLVLGGININNDATLMNATGTLYSVKYWEEDLGEGECMQLANWCHETIDFAVADFREIELTPPDYSVHSTIPGGDSAFQPAVVLHALNASEMGKIEEPQLSITEGASIGWEPSVVRTFYNNRVFQALPVKLQSIIGTQSVPHVKSYSNGSAYTIGSDSTTSSDRVFAPSCVELNVGGTTASKHAAEAAGPFSWCHAGQLKVMEYSNGDLNQISSLAKYTNLRFPYKSISLNNVDNTIYYNYPVTNSSFYSWMHDEKSITLRSGDILIPAINGATTYPAYIYVTAEQVLAGAPITNSSESFLSNTSGGWIEATGWWTRSVPDSIQNKQYAKFIYTDISGSVVTSSGRSQGIVYSLAL